MHLKYLQTLKDIAEAELGVIGRFKIASGVIFKNKLVAIGVNSYKSHPLMSKFGKNPQAIFLHAEVDAIKNALRVITLRDLEKSELLVVRIKLDGTLGNSKPCSGCMRAIEHFNLRTVYYSTETGMEKLE